MNVLVTGGAGYVGSVLIPKLIARGHRVRVVDVGYFGFGHLRSLRPPVDLIREDIRRVSTDPAFLRELLDGSECIIHLAAISNDPSAELDPDLTDEVNYCASLVLAEGAKGAGIPFLFSSSCSVYGEAEGMLGEDTPVNPLTAYARSKVQAEHAIETLADGSWAPVILRNGTLFGYSPRMRFDLVVNIFSLYSTLYNEIRVFGDGEQWRPFLYVGDCARAFVHFVEKTDHRYLTYNVVHQNLRVADLVALFQTINPRLKVIPQVSSDVDRRNYRASAIRLEEEGFKTRIDVVTGAEDMIEAIISGLIPDPESIFYRNSKWLKELTQIGSKNHRDVLGFMDVLTQVQNWTRA